MCSKYAALSLRAGEHDGEGLLGVLRVEQDAGEVEDLLGGAGASGKYHDAVRQPHERLETLLDVRQDRQLGHDRVGRLGGDDARLGDADVAAVLDALLGVADRGALHRPLHGAGSAAGAHVEPAQPELVAHVLAVLVLVSVDRVPAPAHHQVGARLVVEQVRIAQHVEDRVGDGSGIVEIEAPALQDLVGDEHHVAQHREQVLLDAADHLPVDEGGRRCVLHLELHPVGVAHDADVEVAVAGEDFLGVVGGRPGVEHRQRAAAEQRVQPPLPGVEQLVDLAL